MKVPIRYKSSDRYNAGVDVVYDDESKMQYAPFIYAGTQSGDNGTDDGGDEEGEDSMVVNVIPGGAGVPASLDKTWTEINNAISDGKIVMVVSADGAEFTVGYVVSVLLLSDQAESVVDELTVDANGEPVVVRFSADTPDGVLQQSPSDDGPT